MLPEEDLWTEVIAQALRDLTHPKSPKYAAREARDWPTSESQEVGSFTWVCWLLNIEPGFIRAALAKAQQRDLWPSGKDLFDKLG